MRQTRTTTVTRTSLRERFVLAILLTSGWCGCGYASRILQDAPIREVEYTGQAANNGAVGAVRMRMTMSLTRISGLFSFDGQLCGGGRFAGTRSGYNLRFQFVSQDPDCVIDHGRTFVFEGEMSHGYRQIDGLYTIPSAGQRGSFHVAMTAERSLAPGIPDNRAVVPAKAAVVPKLVLDPTASPPPQQPPSADLCAEYDSFECAAGVITRPSQVDIDSFSRTRFYTFQAQPNIQYIINLQELATQQTGRYGQRTVTIVLYDADRRRIDYRILRNGTGGQIRHTVYRATTLFVSVGADRPSQASIDGYAFIISEARG